MDKEFEKPTEKSIDGSAESSMKEQRENSEGESIVDLSEEVKEVDKIEEVGGGSNKSGDQEDVQLEAKEEQGQDKDQDQELEKNELIEEKEQQDEKGKFKETVKELLKKHNKLIKAIIIVLAILLITYLGVSAYFMEHFYVGTKLNNIDVSGKTIKEVKEIMELERQAYTLTLKEKGDKDEQIKAEDIGLKYVFSDKIAEFKDSQNPYKWPMSYFNAKDSEFTLAYNFNKELLRKQIDKLSCFNPSTVIEPQNPSFKYIGNSFCIIDEVDGSKIDKDILYSYIVSTIQNGEKEIVLESIDCYIKPKYNSNSKEVIDAKDTLNLYASTKVTYTFGEKEEKLDGSIINKWLLVDDDFKVIIDEESVKKYIDKLSKNYNTIGKTRSFITPSGKSISVARGDYGWSINKAEETRELIEAIKKGKTLTRKPKYSQSAFSYGKNDIGDTFVEIDLAKQHIWFYKNGSLVVDGDIVTGNVSKNHTTPKGIYRLKYKVRNVVLRGPGYASPVDFWMPFNGGIGIHDANWRSEFGGKIYKTNGSHGCINCPYDVAKAIYNNIEPNIPVICH